MFDSKLFDFVFMFVDLFDQETDGQGPFIETVDHSGYCVLAWVACLLCFWPIGICAVINSHKVRQSNVFYRVIRIGSVTQHCPHGRHPKRTRAGLR